MEERIYFADETEAFDKKPFLGFISVDKTFVFGGYSIPAKNILLLQQKVEEVKKRHDISPVAPIKWNLKDRSLAKFYLKYLGRELYERVLEKADDIRRDILKAMSDEELDMQILVACSHRLSVNSRGIGFYSECFTNYLQRVGLDLQYNTANDAKVVLDTQAKECLSPTAVR